MTRTGKAWRSTNKTELLGVEELHAIRHSLTRQKQTGEIADPRFHLLSVPD